MTSRTILIPGTGGNKLLKDGVSLGHPVVLNARLFLLKAAGMSVEQTVLDMSMEHRPGQAAPVKTTLSPDSEVTPGPPLDVAYGKLLDRIEGRSSFPYDWRADLEYNAGLLIDYLEQERPDAGRWKLVTHSQGGLLALVASGLYADRKGTASAFSELVSHLCMVAPPVYGTVDAANALVVGSELGDEVRGEFRRIAGTWPALYQMLPDWRCIKLPQGGDSNLGLFSYQTWQPYPWVLPFLVQRGYEIRRKYLEYPTQNLQGVQYSYLFARNQKTADRVIASPGAAIDFPAGQAAGDGLVPLDITRARMTSAEKNRTEVIGPDEHTPPHSMLLTDDAVVTLVLKRLEQ
ncbi:MAG: hypothetical protein FJ109_05460 [Deltaproteobacteria bacterium]|nr:hypothetical protein [Deltaproteobacteria bacterium]